MPIHHHYATGYVQLRVILQSVDYGGRMHSQQIRGCALDTVGRLVAIDSFVVRAISVALHIHNSKKVKLMRQKVCNFKSALGCERI